MPYKILAIKGSFMLALLFAIQTFIRSLVGGLRDPRIRGLFLFVGIIILIGTLFYHHIEGWGYLDCVYFCVITLATVGYGDFVPTKSVSKIFTIFYLFIGIGAFLVFVNAISMDILKRRGERMHNPRLNEGEDLEETKS